MGQIQPIKPIELMQLFFTHDTGLILGILGILAHFRQLILKKDCGV
jgi:hypothetical protein